VLRRPDHRFGHKDLMPYGWIDEWVFSYGGRYVSGWIMGLRRTVNGRRTLWILVYMTFRGLTELQEQSRNAAHTSAITHWVETNAWNQLDQSRRWIAAGDGSRPEMDRGIRGIAAGEGLRPEMDNMRWIPSGDGSRPVMNRDWIWMDEK